MLALGVALAEAPERPSHEMIWSLSVEGVPVGTRTVRVAYQEEDGTFVRVLESYTELSGSTLSRKQRKLDYRQRLTANSEDHKPASFHSVLETNGVGREIQAHYGRGKWTVTIAEPKGSKTHTLSGKRVDLSTVDLLDPESDRTLHGRDHVRVLTAETGKILDGPILPEAAMSLAMGDERLEVDVFTWETSEGTWRFWYSKSGFLLRYRIPLLGLAIDGQLTGAAPRTLDEFPVRGRPLIVQTEPL